MAALFCLLFHASQELFRVGSVLIKSGFSLKECVNYIKLAHQEYLFNRYLLEFNNNNMNYSRNRKMQEKDSCSSLDFDEIEEIEIIEGVEITESTFYDEIDPNLVYTNSDLGEIKEGTSFTVKGRILPNCERLSVNLVLLNMTRDIALHLNPRLPQNYVVRNCRVKDVWGTEEVTSPQPFTLHRGENFTIQILVSVEEYLISINGHHFASFRHRLPYNQVRCLEVKGDVEKIEFQKNEVTEYPNRLEDLITDLSKLKRMPTDVNVLVNFLNELNELNEEEDLPSEEMQMPFYGKLKEKFANGLLLTIVGRVKMLPHSFYINLQKGQEIWPHPIIAFHFNPRFLHTHGKPVICKNSWIDGKWGQEECSEIQTNFLPGHKFILNIHCAPTAYEVYLNSKLIADYKFRIGPEIVDAIYIQGDIKLFNVDLYTNVEDLFP